MTSPKGGWLTQQQALDIHSRLAEDDPVAPSDLAAAYLDLLIEWLEQHNRGIDPHICATAAEDAILALIKNPLSYKPDRQTLEVYLRMSAAGDLKNALRSEARHSKRRADLIAVELSPSDRKSLWEASDPALVVELHEYERAVEESSAYGPIPRSVQAKLTAEETKVLGLMRAGERKTVVFAQALGIEHLSPQTQQAEVKRTKDRLKRRLERAKGE